jgi:hypothetical protein
VKTIAGLEKPAIEFSYEGVTVGYPMFIRPLSTQFLYRCGQNYRWPRRAMVARLYNTYENKALAV